MTENAAKEAELIKHFGNGRLMDSEYGPIFVLDSAQEVARRRRELLREARLYVGSHHIHEAVVENGKIISDPCERCDLLARIEAELKEG